MTVVYAHRDRIVDGKMDFAPRAKEPVADQINALIDQALEGMVALQEPRGYLGGSRMGLACHRQLGYEYFKGHADRQAWRETFNRNPVLEHRTSHTFPGKAIRRFEMGHAHEEVTAKWLRMAGFELTTHKPSGGQIGFGVAPDPETGESRVAGHIDGRIESGPIYLPYPLLWEHKIMKAKKWQECFVKGVKEIYPVYWYQCQTYMGYMELENALFTALNTDTSELLFETIKFDREAAQWATDRGVAVITAERPEDLPRIGKDRTDWRCKFCDFKDLCWSEPGGAQVAEVPRPSWL